MANTIEFSKRTLDDIGKQIAGKVYEQLDKSSPYFCGELHWKKPALDETETQGWSFEFGGVKENKPRMQIWLDRFAQLGGERFYAGFHSESGNGMHSLLDAAPAAWTRKHTLTPRKIQYGSSVQLLDPLPSEFYGKSVLEKHPEEVYFGFYDPIDPSDEIAQQRFAQLAVSFFVDMIRARYPLEQLPISIDDYPSIVERRVVRSHLVRERNKKLADMCKSRDGYRCQVCEFVFEKMYGELGESYAESHHVIPLSQLKDSAPTKLDDLITVCANCHRMLHRMEGRVCDIETLRKKIQQN